MERNMDLTYLADTGFTAGEYPRKQNKRRLLRYLKSEALAALYAKDNFYKTIIALFMPILVFCTMLAYRDALSFIFTLLSEYMEPSACELLYRAVSGCSFAVFAFFIYASAAGSYEFISGLKTKRGVSAAQPDSADFAALLAPIASRTELKKTFLTFIRTVLISGLCAFLLWILWIVCRIFLAEYETVFIICSSFLIAVLIGVIVHLFYCLLAVPFLKRDGKNNARERMRISCKVMRKYRFCAVRMFFSFIPLILLSLFTFGVLFFLYVLPYMVLSYGKLAEFAYLEYNLGKMPVAPSKAVGDITC